MQNRTYTSASKALNDNSSYFVQAINQTLMPKNPDGSYVHNDIPWMYIGRDTSSILRDVGKRLSATLNGETFRTSKEFLEFKKRYYPNTDITAEIIYDDPVAEFIFKAFMARTLFQNDQRKANQVYHLMKKFWHQPLMQPMKMILSSFITPPRTRQESDITLKDTLLKNALGKEQYVFDIEFIANLDVNEDGQLYIETTNYIRFTDTDNGTGIGIVYPGTIKTRCTFTEKGPKFEYISFSNTLIEKFCLQNDYVPSDIDIKLAQNEELANFLEKAKTFNPEIKHIFTQLVQELYTISNNDPKVRYDLITIANLLELITINPNDPSFQSKVKEIAKNLDTNFKKLLRQFLFVINPSHNISSDFARVIQDNNISYEQLLASDYRIANIEQNNKLLKLFKDSAKYPTDKNTWLDLIILNALETLFDEDLKIKEDIYQVLNQNGKLDDLNVEEIKLNIFKAYLDKVIVDNLTKKKASSSSTENSEITALREKINGITKIDNGLKNTHISSLAKSIKNIRSRKIKLLSRIQILNYKLNPTQDAERNKRIESIVIKLNEIQRSTNKKDEVEALFTYIGTLSDTEYDAIYHILQNNGSNTRTLGLLLAKEKLASFLVYKNNYHEVLLLAASSNLPVDIDENKIYIQKQSENTYKVTYLDREKNLITLEQVSFGGSKLHKIFPQEGVKSINRHGHLRLIDEICTVCNVTNYKNATIIANLRSALITVCDRVTNKHQLNGDISFITELASKIAAIIKEHNNGNEQALQLNIQTIINNLRKIQDGEIISNFNNALYGYLAGTLREMPITALSGQVVNIEENEVPKEIALRNTILQQLEVIKGKLPIVFANQLLFSTAQAINDKDGASIVVKLQQINDFLEGLCSVLNRPRINDDRLRAETNITVQRVINVAFGSLSDANATISLIDCTTVLTQLNLKLNGEEHQALAEINNNIDNHLLTKACTDLNDNNNSRLAQTTVSTINEIRAKKLTDLSSLTKIVNTIQQQVRGDNHDNEEAIIQLLAAISNSVKQNLDEKLSIQLELLSAILGIKKEIKITNEFKEAAKNIYDTAWETVKRTQTSEKVKETKEAIENSVIELHNSFNATDAYYHLNENNVSILSLINILNETKQILSQLNMLTQKPEKETKKNKQRRERNIKRQEALLEKQQLILDVYTHFANVRLSPASEKLPQNKPLAEEIFLFIAGEINIGSDPESNKQLMAVSTGIKDFMLGNGENNNIREVLQKLKENNSSKNIDVLERLINRLLPAPVSALSEFANYFSNPTVQASMLTGEFYLKNNELSLVSRLFNGLPDLPLLPPEEDLPAPVPGLGQPQAIDYALRPEDSEQVQMSPEIAVAQAANTDVALTREEIIRSLTKAKFYKKFGFIQDLELIKAIAIESKKVQKKVENAEENSIFDDPNLEAWIDLAVIKTIPILLDDSGKLRKDIYQALNQDGKLDSYFNEFPDYEVESRIVVAWVFYIFGPIVNRLPPALGGVQDQVTLNFGAYFGKRFDQRLAELGGLKSEDLIKKITNRLENSVANERVIDELREPIAELLYPQLFAEISSTSTDDLKISVQSKQLIMEFNTDPNLSTKKIDFTAILVAVKQGANDEQVREMLDRIDLKMEYSTQYSALSDLVINQQSIDAQNRQGFRDFMLECRLITNQNIYLSLAQTNGYLKRAYAELEAGEVLSSNAKELQEILSLFEIAAFEPTEIKIVKDLEFRDQILLDVSTYINTNGHNPRYAIQLLAALLVWQTNPSRENIAELIKIYQPLVGKIAEIELESVKGFPSVSSPSAATLSASIRSKLDNLSKDIIPAEALKHAYEILEQLKQNYSEAKKTFLVQLVDRFTLETEYRNLRSSLKRVENIQFEGWDRFDRIIVGSVEKLKNRFIRLLAKNRNLTEFPALFALEAIKEMRHFFTTGQYKFQNAIDLYKYTREVIELVQLQEYNQVAIDKFNSQQHISAAQTIMLQKVYDDLDTESKSKLPNNFLALRSNTLKYSLIKLLLEIKQARAYKDVAKEAALIEYTNKRIALATNTAEMDPALQSFKQKVLNLLDSSTIDYTKHTASLTALAQLLENPNDKQARNDLFRNTREVIQIAYKQFFTSLGPRLKQTEITHDFSDSKDTEKYATLFDLRRRVIKLTSLMEREHSLEELLLLNNEVSIFTLIEIGEQMLELLKESDPNNDSHEKAMKIAEITPKLRDNLSKVEKYLVGKLKENFQNTQPANQASQTLQGTISRLVEDDTSMATAKLSHFGAIEVLTNAQTLITTNTPASEAKVNDLNAYLTSTSNDSRDALVKKEIDTSNNFGSELNIARGKLVESLDTLKAANRTPTSSIIKQLNQLINYAKNKIQGNDSINVKRLDYFIRLVTALETDFKINTNLNGNDAKKLRELRQDILLTLKEITEPDLLTHLNKLVEIVKNTLILSTTKDSTKFDSVSYSLQTSLFEINYEIAKQRLRDTLNGLNTQADRDLRQAIFKLINKTEGIRNSIDPRPHDYEQMTNMYKNINTVLTAQDAATRNLALTRVKSYEGFKAIQLLTAPAQNQQNVNRGGDPEVGNPAPNPEAGVLYLTLKNNQISMQYLQDNTLQTRVLSADEIRNWNRIPNLPAFPNAGGSAVEIRRDNNSELVRNISKVCGHNLAFNYVPWGGRIHTTYVSVVNKIKSWIPNSLLKTLETSKSSLYGLFSQKQNPLNKRAGKKVAAELENFVNNRNRQQ